MDGVQSASAAAASRQALKALTHRTARLPSFPAACGMQKAPCFLGMLASVSLSVEAALRLPLVPYHNL